MSKIQQTIAAGGVAIGAYQSTPSQIIAEGMGQVGFDWLCIDLQHGEIEGSALIGIIQAIQHGDSDILVRVPENDPVPIMRALDCGAHGVVVPLVSSAAQAASAVASCRYGPEGIRSVGQTRKMFFPFDSYATSATAAPPLCFVMVETGEGLENIEAIAATPGLDGILIGPADLALSMGLAVSIPPHPQIADAVMKIANQCQRHKIICATLLGIAGDMETLVSNGVQMIGVGFDIGYAGAGARAALKESTAALEKIQRASD